MINKICRDTRQEIDESELHEALSESALTHLQSCADCQGFRAARTRLRDLVGSLEPVMAPADFDFRLRARLAAQQQSRSRIFSGFRLTVPAMIAAAILVMLVGSIFLINQRTGTSSPPVVKVEQPNNSSATNLANGPNQNLASNATSGAQNSKPESGQTGQRVLASVNRRPSGSLTAKTRGGRSTDFLESPTQSIRGSDDAGAVSLAAPVKPLVVSMEDDRGA